MDTITMLPQECISLIISFTSPRDACRSSVVSPAFKSAADADAVWERFLPSDYHEIISNSASSSSNLVSLSKKELYLHLCDNPILISNGTMSFALEKQSGKKCYMVGARALSIAWGDAPYHWQWVSAPESRFSEVAKLGHVWWLEVEGKIKTSVLSPKTTYVAYLVYKITARGTEFRKRPVELCVSLEGSGDGERHSVLLDPSKNRPQLSRDRGDGWMEIEMGDFFNEHGDDGFLVCSLREVNGWLKSVLMIEGIELRPKDEYNECFLTRMGYTEGASGLVKSNQPAGVKEIEEEDNEIQGWESEMEGDLEDDDGGDDAGADEFVAFPRPASHEHSSRPSGHGASDFASEILILMRQMSNQMNSIDRRLTDMDNQFQSMDNRFEYQMDSFQLCFELQSARLTVIEEELRRLSMTDHSPPS